MFVTENVPALFKKGTLKLQEMDDGYRRVAEATLMIESGGLEGQQRFTDIKNPDQVQRLIHGQIDARTSRSHQSGGSGGSDVASQLEKLEGMLERGTLSSEEFAREKRRLLGE